MSPQLCVWSFATPESIAERLQNRESSCCGGPLERLIGAQTADVAPLLGGCVLARGRRAKDAGPPAAPEPAWVSETPATWIQWQRRAEREVRFVTHGPGTGSRQRGQATLGSPGRRLEVRDGTA
jgi:hypothetical protein